MSDNPTDAFKQALAETARTIAGEPELEVSYTADPSGVVGRKMRLPQVSRRMPAREVALARGQADAMALRMRNHDSGTHSRRMPQGDAAREVYDALETARCEMVGARAMPGVARNLDAVLTERGERANWGTMTDAEDAPLGTACALALRKATTDLPLPKAAQSLLDLFEERFEGQASQTVETLLDSLGDQEEFARRSWQLIDDMGLGEELGPTPEEMENDESLDEQEEPQQDPESSDDGETAESDQPDDSPPESSDDDQSSDQSTTDTTAVVSDQESDDEAETDEQQRREGAPPPYTPPAIPDSDASRDYRIFNRENDEEISTARKGCSMPGVWPASSPTRPRRSASRSRRTRISAIRS